jgi:lysophospholipase
LGFQVYLLDFSGHGRSEREIENRSVTHIDHFRRYARDLADLTSRIDRKLPLYLTGFGMGGAVAMLYMQNNPERVQSACLVAPLIGIHLPQPRGLNRWKLRRSVRRGLSRELIPGSVCYQPGEVFERSDLKSFHRFVWYKEHRAADSGLQNNAYTLGWLNAALQSSDLIFSRRTKKIASKILLIEAGNDSVVPAEYYTKLLTYLKSGSHVRLAGAVHRIQNGNNGILGDLMKLMEAFFVNSNSK